MQEDDPEMEGIKTGCCLGHEWRGCQCGLTGERCRWEYEVVEEGSQGGLRLKY